MRLAVSKAQPSQLDRLFLNAPRRRRDGAHAFRQLTRLAKSIVHFGRDQHALSAPGHVAVLHRCDARPDRCGWHSRQLSVECRRHFLGRHPRAYLDGTAGDRPERAIHLPSVPQADFGRLSVIRSGAVTLAIRGFRRSRLLGWGRRSPC